MLKYALNVYKHKCVFQLCDTFVLGYKAAFNYWLLMSNFEVVILVHHTMMVFLFINLIMYNLNKLATFVFV